mgnify:CR=1 FL=1
MQNLIVALIALPLFSSAILLIAGRRVDKWGHLLATLVSLSTFVIGSMEFFAMKSRLRYLPKLLNSIDGSRMILSITNLAIAHAFSSRITSSSCSV